MNYSVPLVKGNDDLSSANSLDHLSPLELAVAYATAGFYVFACKPDKKPLTDRWQIADEGSTRDLERVREIWTQHPKAAIGLPMGLNKLAVLDIDTKVNKIDNPYYAEEWLRQNGIDLTTCVKVETPSLSGKTWVTHNRGVHYYFRDNLGENGCTLGVINTDVRAGAMYVLAPGSRVRVPHVLREGSSDTMLVRGAYKLEAGPSLLDADLVLPELPAAIRSAMQAAEAKRKGAKVKTSSSSKAGVPQAPVDLDLNGLPSLDAFDLDELQTRDPELAAVLQRPTSDRSKNRWNLARRTYAEFRNAGWTPAHLLALYMKFPEICGVYGGAIRGGPGQYGDYDVDREFERSQNWATAYLKNTIGAADMGPSVAEVADAIITEFVLTGVSQDNCEAFLDAADGVLTPEQIEQFRTLYPALVAGKADALARFLTLIEPAEVDGSPKLSPRLRTHLQTCTSPLEIREHLVNDVLAEREVVIAAGAPNAGKTADLIHLGLCVAQGLPYHGHHVNQAGVLFAGNERPEEDQAREKMNTTHYGRPAGLPYWTLPGTVNLWSEDGRPTKDEKEIIATANAMEKATGFPCKLIITDNLRRVLKGNSEKDDLAVERVMAAIERISRATGASYIMIAHTVRSGTRYSGSGMIESMSDSVWMYSANDKKTGGSVRFTKQRFSRMDTVTKYRFESAVYGVGKDGSEKTVPVSVDDAVTKPTFGKVDIEDDKPEAAIVVSGDKKKDKGKPAPAPVVPMVDTMDARMAMMAQVAERYKGEAFRANDLYELVAGARVAAGLPDVKLSVLKEVRAALGAEKILTDDGNARARRYRLAAPPEAPTTH